MGEGGRGRIVQQCQSETTSGFFPFHAGTGKKLHEKVDKGRVSLRDTSG